ncbi:MAG: superoxide dismutase, Ni [Cyanobacteria bacterium]|jgi:nickel superoxide dismutase|nr:superoxide dismutase, Ni [Cyanobacteria bacterium GSL.Bin1]
MLKQITTTFKSLFPAEAVHAHCDGPCGVYDPSSARVAAEAVLSMTKKLIDLEPENNSKEAQIAYQNTFSRFVQIKEEQAQIAKEELLILWTDYFKEKHLQQYPDLHTTFWKAAKLCSACKMEVNLQHAQELMDTVQKIHNMFWQSKERDIPWYQAS